MKPGRRFSTTARACGFARRASIVVRVLNRAGGLMPGGEGGAVVDEAVAPRAHLDHHVLALLGRAPSRPARTRPPTPPSVTPASVAAGRRTVPCAFGGTVAATVALPSASAQPEAASP